MADNNKSVWENLASQVSSPWDWFAIGVGAAGGAVVTIASHGSDLGTSIAAGAGTGLAARKGIVASFQRPGLRHRAQALRARIVPLKHPDAAHLLTSLDTETDLWAGKIISNDEFNAKLNELTNQYRICRNNPP